MRSTCLAELLWGKKARFSYLIFATLILLFGMLGSREIWTQEHRWADIVYTMFYHHDFLHPILDGHDYYDKPLLSYWLIAGFTTLCGKLTTGAMRLPSALAGLLAVSSIYWLGSHLKDKRLGLLAGWMLLTTFYFIFWARTSSADMLNMAGSLFAVAWYFAKKSKANLFDYTVFFLILALTALCKGLVGPVVAILVILPDVILQRSWKKHLQWRVVVAVLIALIIYILPFWASAHFSRENYGANGFYEVYRENMMRYFQPFDHKGPFYTYFIYLPIYLLPWTFFFIPALFYLKPRWSSLSSHAKWMVLSTLILFLFFTLSGSRRSYYVLPIVPFAILLTADWILSGRDLTKRFLWAGRVAALFFVLWVSNFIVVQPLYYSQASMEDFSADLQAIATQIKPASKWKFVLLDPESKVRFYLHLSPEIINESVVGNREEQTQTTLLKTWPILRHPPQDTILISRKMYLPLLKEILKGYVIVENKPGFIKKVLKVSDENATVAFIPKR
ncbi:MAG: arnT 1 [Gammaproteobacteria bacterium]|jgi:4-amino-4-deoxy-L-arabinose transferase-like glycosyltransferase|nr:arnT 1 [Gammaproteobacteria bacterium]